MIAFLTSAARRLAGVAVLAFLTVGVPYALARYIGWPLPHHVPTWQEIGTALTSPLTDMMLGNALVCLLWLAWAAFVWSLVAEFAEVLAGIRLPQPRAIAPARGLAALLVAAITGGVLATAAQAAPTLVHPAATGHASAVAVVSPSTVSVDLVTVAQQSPVEIAETPYQARTNIRQDAGEITLVAAGKTYTCVVKHGDTLSEIAQDWLGDANRWPEIFALNRGDHFDVGGTLTNPNLIYPGWTLELPDDAIPPASAPPITRPAPRPQQPDIPEPATPAPPDATQPAQPDEPAQPGPALTPPASAAPSPTSAAPSARAGDDGVVEPAPPTGPTSSGTSTPTSTPTAEQAPSPSRTPASPPGVSLGSGSWIDAGLVAAVLAAVALVWAHRRRRYTPRPPSPELRLDDPNVAPMPDVVTSIRRRLRRPAPQPVEDTAAEAPPVVDEDSIDETVDEPSPVLDLASAGPPIIPALANPLIEVWPPAGLGLTGQGAEAAARGFLVAALAAGGLEDPDARGIVVIPSGTLATLLGAAAVTVPDIPRLTVTGGLSDALALLEEQTMHRSRMCFDYEVDNVSGLRETDPMAEPLPPMVLIADTTAAHERARIAALLTQGQRLDIHGILLGAWPDGNTVIVTEDGATSPADGDAVRHGSHPADVGRLTVIDPTEAADLLRVLGESHTGEPQPPAPAERPPLTKTGDEHTAETQVETDHVAVHNDEKDPHSSDPPLAVPEPALAATDITVPIAVGPTDQANADAHDEDVDNQRLDDGAGVETAADSKPGHVEVQLLGEARVVDIDTAEPLRGKALELLVYLAARGGTASQEAILEDLLPEARTSKAPHRLHTYVYNLRRVLKRTGGPATYLSHPDRRYILHREAISIDLWQLGDALTEAAAATTPTVRVAALRRAVDAYQGPLAEGKGYEWIEPYREAVQRQAVDAALALADALADQPGEALAALTAAITHSPYVESLYQAAIRAHAALGDAAAIRDLQRQLARRLDEIDTEVSDETVSLAGALVAQLQRRRRVSGEGKSTP